MSRTTELLVLAGGFGTRLRSVVTEVPKPLAPVVGRPFLQYLMESWAEQGVTRLVFLLHHQANLVRGFLEGIKASPVMRACEIATLTEPIPLGTGGAVAYAVREFGLSNSFMVANADTWLGAGIQALTDVGAPSMAVVYVDNAGRYGSVGIEQGLVTAFEEKNPQMVSGWINAGLYHLDASHFVGWNGQAFSLERELFPEMVSKRQLSTVALNCDFIDIGIPDDYFRFCRWVEAGQEGPL